MITATVVAGELDLPKGLIEEGARVTVLVPDDERGFELSDAESAALRESVEQIAAGDWIAGEALLREIRHD
jgi:hypothetical protein